MRENKKIIHYNSITILALPEAFDNISNLY